MRLVLISLAGLAAMLAAPEASAENFAVGVGVGTGGIEAQGAYKVNDVLALRGSFNYLSYDVGDIDGEDLTYSADFDASTVGAFVDLRPFSNAFTLTAGAFIGERQVDLTARANSNVEIGGAVYTPAEAGTIDGVFDLGDIAPYVGLGFDNTFSGTGRGLGFRIAAGVAFGDPSVTLTSSSPLVSQSDLDEEARQIEEDGDSLKTYPIISAGLNYRF